MKRTLAVYLILASLVITSFLSKGAVTAKACPVREPVTLLSLYKDSNMIVIATYNGTEKGELKNDRESYRVYESTETFSVSTTLIGRQAADIKLSNPEYEYGRLPKGEVVESVSLDEREETDKEGLEPREKNAVINGRYDLKTGDKVLLFLKYDEENKKLELADDEDGIKRMPDEVLAKYSKLITDLHRIHSSSEPNIHSIIDWLVRAALDPDTRWEGTYELYSSQRQLNYYDHLQKESKNGDAEAEERIKQSFGEGKEFENHPMHYARLLDENQKEQLAQLVTLRSRDAKWELVRGDSELLSLVTQWKRSDIMASLLDALRLNSFEGWQASSLMTDIADGMDDEVLSDIAESYSDIYYLTDTDIVEDDDEDADTDETAPEAGTDTETPETETKVPASKDQTSAETAPQPEAPKKTYGQLRSELMDKFLARASILINSY